ncbi:hypothetical protein LINGRAHAP2_LOCUS11284 [Linum grandiflorum]
MGSPPFPYLP